MRLIRFANVTLTFKANAFVYKDLDHRYIEKKQFVLPVAADSEFLVEKSPRYAERYHQRSQKGYDLRAGNLETVKRARQMYEMNPNLKLMFFIRDPVKRAYSQITQIFRPNMRTLRHRMKEYASVDEAIGNATEYMRFFKCMKSPSWLIIID